MAPAVNVTANMTLSGNFRFNSRNQVIAYDINFLRFTELLANIFGDILAGNNTKTYQDLYGPPGMPISTAICYYATQFCAGPNKQYDSLQQCVGILMTKPTLPLTGAIRSDCIICRQVHSILLRCDTI